MARHSPGDHVLIADREGEDVPSINGLARRGCPDYLPEDAAEVCESHARGVHRASERGYVVVWARIRSWREDCRTWEALRHLDDRQLRDLGIATRPWDLVRKEFP